ncbi:MFS transporter [Lysinibacillus sp. RC79]|uniref:MFS transporter n=1 Tax=Lysinibacillus sp. RC79 TaxID=3156296 RepID=UPI003513AC78
MNTSLFSFGTVTLLLFSEAFRSLSVGERRASSYASLRAGSRLSRSLTHNLSINKENVYHYAEKKVHDLHVDPAEQEQILIVTKEKIQNKGLESNIEKKQGTNYIGISQQQKESMIKEKVNNALNEVPVEYREIKRVEITNQVTKAVEEKIENINREINTFSDDISHYAEKEMAKSFTDLYKVSVPIILLCSLVAFMFRNRKFEVDKRKGQIV